MVGKDLGWDPVKEEFDNEMANKLMVRANREKYLGEPKMAASGSKG